MKRAPTLLGIGRNAFQSVDQFNVACCNRPLKMAIRLKAKKEEKREREREKEQRTRRNVLVFGYKCFSSISEHVTCVHNRAFIATLPFTFFLFFTSRPESVIFFSPPSRFLSNLSPRSREVCGGVTRARHVRAARIRCKCLHDPPPPSLPFLMGHVTGEITEGGGGERDP